MCRYAAAGAGKTTLLNNILTNQANQRVAVLVNDMAALNIDQRLVAENVVQQSGQELVALSNGCICCTIREDLVREIRALAAQQVGALGWHFMLPEHDATSRRDNMHGALTGCHLGPVERLNTSRAVVADADCGAVG